MHFEKRIFLFLLVIVLGIFYFQSKVFAENIDSIHVWSGNIGEIKKIGTVSVPEYCWKVIYIKQPNKFVAYLFKNDDSKPDGIDNNEVPLTKITKLTGFKFR